MLFKRDPTQFYRIYLADMPTERTPATIQMQVGSVFDILVKEALTADLNLPLQEVKPNDISAIAWAAGQHVFHDYCESGAYDCLFEELEAAHVAPLMEERIAGSVNICGESIQFCGLPDLFYSDAKGTPVVLDWKVNGYFSNATKSPNRGWLRLYSRDSTGAWVYKSPHKDVSSCLFGATEMVKNIHLEEIYVDWAIQLTIYSWVLGHDHFLGRVEQIVGKPPKGVRCDATDIESLASRPKPELRIASHCARPSLEFCNSLRETVLDLHRRIQTNHFFPDLSRAASQRLCRRLDKGAGALVDYEELIK
jgi:hypothetical protein